MLGCWQVRGSRGYGASGGGSGIAATGWGSAWIAASHGGGHASVGTSGTCTIGLGAHIGFLFRIIVKLSNLMRVCSTTLWHVFHLCQLSQTDTYVIPNSVAVNPWL